MRMLRIAAAALLAAAAGLAVPAPARAGGFATTVLDPLPATIVPGVAYTVGFWVLQHGSHPYVGDLGKVALKVTDDKGAVATHAGAALPEPGHFAAAVVFGRAGTWRVTAVQGLFQPYEIGTVTVPGGLALQPDEFGWIKIDYRHWGAIRPPQPPMEKAGAAPVAAEVPVAAGAGAPPSPRGGSWGAAVIGGGVLAAAAGALLLNRRGRLRLPGRTPR